MSNLVSLLSFDSRSIKALLNQKHSQNFQKDIPLFYKIRHGDPECKDQILCHSAIDIALENN